MKKAFISILFLLLSHVVYAQLEVKEGSFKEVPGFVNINTEKMYDDNDKPYAVLKIKTENISSKERRELSFKGDAQTFFEIEYQDGEVWLYISYYASYIKISHEEYSSTEFYFPFDMKPKCGYELILVNKNAPVQEGWGSLTIKTKPEDAASIMLNGRLLPQNSPYNNDMIPSGKYEIVVSKERFETTTKNIEIKDGEKKVVEIEMPYLYGVINIYSEPSEASVYIDNIYYGTTPLGLEKTIIIGEHELKLEKNNCATLIKHFNLDNKNITNIKEALITGQEIKITTNKVGHKLFVDDNYVGESPVNISLSFGEHHIKAIQGSDEIYKTIVMTPDSNTISVNLDFLSNRTFSVNGVSFDMVAIHGGVFTMGGIDCYSSDSIKALPTHTVSVSDFMIGKYEVTQDLWNAVMGSNPSYFKGDKLPVERVSWYDCQEFIKRLNQLTGLSFRLPTEAEWEYAARGGTNTSLYNGENIKSVFYSDDPWGYYRFSPNINDLAWSSENSQNDYTKKMGCDVRHTWRYSRKTKKQGTHPVGQKLPNAYGLYDMLGNVSEWCQDWYGEYDSNDQKDPQGPLEGTKRIQRGGSWRSGAGGCVVFNRYGETPKGQSFCEGFRLVYVP